MGAGSASSGAVALPAPGSGEWVWPWWLQRQVTPGSPAWQPADLAGRNRTGRNWTVIGLPEGRDRWLVDRRGLIAPVSGRWALDWWVGATDNWRWPSTEASVRQHLVGDAPVIETVLRIPGGEVVARHWAVPGERADLVVVEIENAGADPVAVALALRPVGPAGRTGVRRAAVEGRCLRADGTVVVRADGAPRQSLVSDAARGDVALAVRANATPAAGDAGAFCPAGWASAVMVWPLAHRATLRAEIPGADTGDANHARAGTGWRRRHRTLTPVAPAGRAPASPRPGAAETARGWAARVTRATRLDLPAGRLTSAIEAQRRHLLLAQPVGADDGRGRQAGARVVAALSTAGLRDEARSHLDAWLDQQDRHGLLGDDAAATAATLWALGTWAGTGPDDGLVARAPLAVARAAERVAGSAPPGDALAALWTAAGLRAAARILSGLGEDRAAVQAARWARSRLDDLLVLLAAGTSAWSGGAVLEAAVLEAAVLEAALLAVVLGVVPAQHPVARAGRLAARRHIDGLPVGAVAEGVPLLGLRPELSLALATSAALAGEDPSDALGWVLSVASPTWTWPTVVEPRLGTGSHGSGHDPLVAAAMWSAARSLLVAEPVVEDHADRGGLIDLLPAVPGEWIGAGLEVHGLATAAGPLSYALRWHGGRPALLWDIEGHGAHPVVTATGLDPTWSAKGRRGEALLGAMPGPVAAPPGGSVAVGRAADATPRGDGVA
jgi:hypothetical protein